MSAVLYHSAIQQQSGLEVITHTFLRTKNESCESVGSTSQSL